MGYSFVTPERDQDFLLPPDMRDWLDESDLALTVVDAVGQINVSAFRAAYRADC